PWCEPCNMLGPILEKVVKERDGELLLAKLNIDRSPDLAAKYGIEAIPAVIAFRDGKPALDFVGMLPEDQLRAFVSQLIPSEADPLARKAVALEKERPAEAETLYRQALKLNDHHEAALVGLARLLVARASENEAVELLTRVNPGGEHTAE